VIRLMLKKRTYSTLLFLVVFGAGAVLLNAVMHTRPNVVLIIIDTLRADKLGCYGFPGDISPELDKMAKKGVQFNNVIAQSSWTRPSIGSMLTSLYPRSLGIYKEKFDILADWYVSLPEILQAKGYSTVGITANPNINKFFNFDQGFDIYMDSHVIFNWMNPEKGKVPMSVKEGPVGKSRFGDNELVAKMEDIFVI